MTSERDTRDAAALSALTELYRDGVRVPAITEFDGGLDKILARGSLRQRRRLGARWAILAGVLTFALVSSVPLSSLLESRWFSSRAPLACQIAGGSLLEGGYLHESGGAGLTMAFNDGSSVAFTSGTRGRLRELERDGARVAIEHGAASFEISRGVGKRWLIDAGPFLIAATDASLLVAWEPLSERFELTLTSGRATVNGPVAAGEIRLRAGQRLAVDLTKAQAVITDGRVESVGAASATPLLPPVAR